MPVQEAGIPIQREMFHEISLPQTLLIFLQDEDSKWDKIY